MRRAAAGLMALVAMLLAGGPIKADSPRSGGYAAIELQVSTLNEGRAYIIGLSGGYQNNDGTRIGLAIYDLLNGTRFPDQHPDQPARRTKMHWGGVIVAQEFAESDDWRPAVSLVLGGGDVSAYTKKKKESFDQSWYWLVQPSVSIGYQANDSYRPELGAGWRLPLGVDTRGTSNRLLGGPFVSFNNAFTSL